MKLSTRIQAGILGAAIALTGASAAQANQHVADNLNAADQLFNYGMDGCTNVGIAVLAYNNPDIYGPNYVSRDEVARYAQRCNLRF